jgi:hypothetical protein
MATKVRSSIADLLHAAQVAINNTQSDAEIAARMTAYGYDAARMNEGKQRWAAAQAAVNQQTATEGTQREQTAQLRCCEQEARDAYQSLAKVARAVFPRHASQLATLGLTGRTPVNMAGFLTAATTLFDNALNNAQIKTTLASYGYDEAKLQSERAKIAACDAASQQQESAKGASQQATQERDAALKALNDWLSQFIKIARVALRDKPQLLEKMGIVITPRKPRKPKSTLHSLPTA